MHCMSIHCKSTALSHYAMEAGLYNDNFVQVLTYSPPQTSRPGHCCQRGYSYVGLKLRWDTTA